jgi:hypothetical protein
VLLFPLGGWGNHISSPRVWQLSWSQINRVKKALFKCLLPFLCPRQNLWKESLVEPRCASFPAQIHSGTDSYRVFHEGRSWRRTKLHERVWKMETSSSEGRTHLTVPSQVNGRALRWRVTVGAIEVGSHLLVLTADTF